MVGTHGGGAEQDRRVGVCGSLPVRASRVWQGGSQSVGQRRERPDVVRRPGRPARKAGVAGDARAGLSFLVVAEGHGKLMVKNPVFIPRGGRRHGEPAGRTPCHARGPDGFAESPVFGRDARSLRPVFPAPRSPFGPPSLPVRQFLPAGLRTRPTRSTIETVGGLGSRAPWTDHARGKIG